MEDSRGLPFGGVAASGASTSLLSREPFLGFYGYASETYASTPGTSSQNPFLGTRSDRGLEFDFAGLSIWSYDNPCSRWGFGRGLSNGSGLERPFNNDLAVDGKGFPVRSLRRVERPGVELRRLGFNNGDNGDFGYLGLQNWSGLDGEGWSTFLPQSHQALSPNLLWGGELAGVFPIRPSNGNQPFAGLSCDSRGVVDCLACKKSSNRRPHWLQETLNCSSIKDLPGKIEYLAKDRYGCHFLQKKLEFGTPEEIDTVFMEIIDHVDELMTNQFGNYVVQKLVVVCSEEQRTQILLTVTNTDFKLVDICLDTHGIRVIQKLLEHLTTWQQFSIFVSALRPAVVRLTKDTNGHRVIKYCLTNFSHEYNKYILNEVADNCYELATDRIGCCVFQQCVKYSQEEPTERLVAGIIANALLLAQDQFGNYVMQHLLELRIPHITSNVLRKFKGSYLSLSCNKYGSNVVEKCLLVSGEKQSADIIMELLGSPNSSTLLFDPFGNFVIQSALSVSKGTVRKLLLLCIQKNSRKMGSNPYGKRILGWFDRRKLHK